MVSGLVSTVKCLMEVQNNTNDNTQASRGSFLCLSSNGPSQNELLGVVGVYAKTDYKYNSHPVYKKLDGPQIIYVSGMGFWSISRSGVYTDDVLCLALPTTPTPPVTQWKYKFNHQWKDDRTIRLDVIENLVSVLPASPRKTLQNIENYVEGMNTEITKKIVNKIDELNMELGEQNKPPTAELKLIEHQLKEELNKLQLSRKKELQEARKKEEAELEELEKKYKELREKIADKYKLKEENAQEKYMTEKKSIEEIRNSTKVAIEHAIQKLTTNLNKIQSNDDPELGPKVRKDMECPICFEEMKPPTRIFQCSSGHMVCSGCKDTLEGARCPTCKETNIKIRNLAMEALARTIYGQQ